VLLCQEGGPGGLVVRMSGLTVQHLRGADSHVIGTIPEDEWTPIMVGYRDGQSYGRIVGAAETVQPITPTMSDFAAVEHEVGPALTEPTQIIAMEHLDYLPNQGQRQKHWIAILQEYGLSDPAVPVTFPAPLPPPVGTLVYYYPAGGGGPLPAIVTGIVGSATLNLYAFGIAGGSFAAVPRDTSLTPVPSTWRPAIIPGDPAMPHIGKIVLYYDSDPLVPYPAVILAVPDLTGELVDLQVFGGPTTWPVNVPKADPSAAFSWAPLPDPVP
jgi:hypothetical protein